MTASVLIINSNNICLGSDSNVTIDNVKTFTGVKKLHCLCDELPMAIMNYGNAEFAFIDFETIVGEFKKRNEINKLSSVKNIVKNFIEFLKEFTDSEDCDEFIEYYLNEFKKELIILIQEMDEIDFLEFLKNIETKNLLNFLNGYTIDFSEIVPNYMVDFEYVNLKLLHAFSTYLEDNSVGVVIAGFDKEFNRPSFVNFNLFFNNNGKIEWKCNYLEENYDGVSILTFAQDDEIKAFIEGIDKYFENELINYWRDMINILFNDLFESISKNNSFNEDLINVLKYELDTFKNKFGVYESMFNEELSELKNENYDNLRNIIEILPKNDLADLVHFLIMIPSAKRRFSFDLNSVGGDINVCLMSKVDFQWIDYTNG